MTQTERDQYMIVNSNGRMMFSGTLYFCKMYKMYWQNAVQGELFVKDRETGKTIKEEDLYRGEQL